MLFLEFPLEFEFSFFSDWSTKNDSKRRNCVLIQILKCSLNRIVGYPCLQVLITQDSRVIGEERRPGLEKLHWQDIAKQVEEESPWNNYSCWTKVDKTKAWYGRRSYNNEVKKEQHHTADEKPNNSAKHLIKTNISICKGQILNFSYHPEEDFVLQIEILVFIKYFIYIWFLICCVALFLLHFAT